MKLIKSLILTALLIPFLAFGQTDASLNSVTGLAGVDLNKASIKPLYDLGVPYFGKQGIFSYAKCTETISDGQWVFIDESNQLTLADTTESGTEQMRVGVSAADCTTSAPYVWVWLGGGVFEAILTNALAADTALTTTGTGGTAGSGGDAISGCINIDAGVTSTRVTVRCTGFASTNLP